MASYQAIETIGDVLVRLLQSSHDPDDFGGQPLQFSMYQGSDFTEDRMGMGVSLFLYRLVPNGTNRTPAGRRRGNGERELTRLPLDLHYLLTIWARDASMQHRIAGWVMRTLEDTPILPRGVLNAAGPDVFNVDETLEIIINDLTNEDLFRIWDTIGQSYRLSVPYLVRNVWIDSEQTRTTAPPVQERLLEIFQVSSEPR